MLGHLVGFMGLHGGFLMGKTNPNGKACPLGFHCGNFFGNIFLAFILGTPLFLRLPFWELFWDSFWASILGTIFFLKVFGLPFWEPLFFGKFLGFHFGNFFWTVFGLPFWEPTGKNCIVQRMVVLGKFNAVTNYKTYSMALSLSHHPRVMSDMCESPNIPNHCPR